MATNQNKIKMQCKCSSCGIDMVKTNLTYLCDDCRDILEEHSANIADGICTVCKGSCEQMDGTPCVDCDGKGLTK
jgi:hypothetical protein